MSDANPDDGAGSEWAEAASCTWLHEAQLLVSVLEAAGVAATIPNEYTLGVQPLFANLVGGVRVMVPAADLVRARELLAAREGGAKQSSPDDGV